MHETIIIILLILILTALALWCIRLSMKTGERARILHEKWKKQEMEEFRRQVQDASEDTISREVTLRTRHWQEQEEDRLRKDAIKRSREVIHGKVTEHLIPFFPSFDYNPSDARFLGSPIELIVFDGLSEGEVREIIFCEVKSGERKVLSQRERSVARCVQRGAVSFRVLHPGDR